MVITVVVTFLLKLVEHVLAHENSKRTRKIQPGKINLKTNNSILIKPSPIPGARKWAKRKSVCTILAQVIPMATALSIFSMLILFIAAILYLTVAIPMWTAMQVPI